MALTLNYVMRIDVDLAEPYDVGKVPDGYRRVLPIVGGTFSGERLRGTVIAGGADWNMVRADEVMTVRAEYLLKTDDGILIGIHNQGMVRGAAGQMDQVTGGGDVDAGMLYTRLSSRYEAPEGKYDWLNKSIFVGVLLPPENLAKVSMEVYEFA